MRRKRSISRSFAGVYDVLYDNPFFIKKRTDFILDALGSEDGLLLDAGCATGWQIDELEARGRRVVGIDNDSLMLTVARWNGVEAPLVYADLRHLPFSAVFAGVLCLESPLAYLLDDADFNMALRSLHRALAPRGRVVIDTYDYVRMFWPQAMGRMRTAIGPVRVVERHNYDERTRIWTMEQRFAVDEENRTRRFRLTHVLKMRTPDEYAAALERNGFQIREMYEGYPDSLDKRILIVAVAR